MEWIQEHGHKGSQQIVYDSVFVFDYPYNIDAYPTEKKGQGEKRKRKFKLNGFHYSKNGGI